MKVLAATLLMLAAAPTVAPQTPVDYRFDEVKRKVVVTSAEKQVPAAKGQHAQGGDKVQTGWLSYALLSSEHYRARFEIFSATDVQLAAGTPGVILSLERGRLHAMFDKITGSEPRVVKTPGALLAVRGTQYDVEVADDGKTTLKVWEGTVAVSSDLRPEPFLVHAGEAANFSRNAPPSSHEMGPNERSNDPRNHDHGRGPNDAPNGGEHDGHHPQDPHGHGQQPPPPGGRSGGQNTPPPSNNGHH